MHVFVTGATGFVGRAVVKELLARKHTVTALTRSATGSTLLASLGATPHEGSLDDPSSLEAGAATADAVIHLAYNHDFSDLAATVATDRAAVQALGRGLVASSSELERRPLIVTSGTLLLPHGRVGVEADAPNADVEAFPFALRGRNEALAFGFEELGLRVNVVRLPPAVHHADEDKFGFVPIVVGAARKAGVVAYPEGAENHWNAVHRDDAARAYVLALEKGQAGEVFHAVGEGSVRVRDVLQGVASGLGLEMKGVEKEKVGKYYDWFAFILQADSMVSSDVTREKLGWEPREVGLLDDLKLGGYFKTQA